MSEDKKRYYRNKIPVKGIDEEALWEAYDAFCLNLVDDDAYITVFAEDYPDVFYEVEKPLELK